MIQLADLGNRVCILGPSNSGKSTLAQAIGQKTGLDVIHLDQYYHLPDTDWVQRPTEEFVTLHNAAIARDRWVIDGNYSICLDQRLERATGLILLDVSTPTSLLRYINRTLFQSERHGGLSGKKDSLKWAMIHHIIAATPTNRVRCANRFCAVSLPKIRLSSVKEIDWYYQHWGLRSPV